MGLGRRRVGPGAGMARRHRRRQVRRRIALVGGMVAFGAHKMSQSQAQQIQEHTGVPPEELEDEDLETAMAELGITVMPVVRPCSSWPMLADGS